MKKVSIFLCLVCAFQVSAQSNRSNVFSVSIQKEVKPAILELVSGSVTFIDPNDNNVIDANEDCMIQLQIKNIGTGDGYNCVARVASEGAIAGIKCSNVNIPVIPVGKTMTVDIPVNAAMNTETGSINFKIAVDEPMGFGTEQIELNVGTRQFVSPFLKVVDYTIQGSDGGVLTKNKPFDLQLLMQNIEYGKAENVDVTIQLPSGVFLLGGEEKLNFASISAGETKSLEYSLIVNQNYTSNEIPIQIAIKEKYGKYAENRTLTLQLNQVLASNKIEIQSNEQKRGDIQVATLKSKVDKDIPENKQKNPNTFAVIIANENYQSVASVPFALNDGNIFREYCFKTLGVPEKQVKYIPNATGNQIKAQVTWLQNICKAFDDVQIIFYYAGHGIPDESSRTAYLLPVDGLSTDVTTGYKLDDLYAALGSIPAKNVTVFMDACFSGSKRENGMLASARGVAIKARSGMPQGNMVVFSAAQGNETAYPNNDEKHGMFTYFLLKKLQETEGNVTLQELGEYITKNVSQQSILLNGKSQTPCVTPSATMGEEWRNWTLR